MLSIIVACMWVVLAMGVLLLVCAIPGRAPRPLILGALGIAQVAVIVAVVADIAMLVGGFQSPGLVTHISYLLSTPFFIPAGFALTYKKFDRWGLLIVAVATMLAAIMIIRQVQTLGIPFGYLNV